MANFALRSTDTRSIPPQAQMGWLGLLASEPKGGRPSELVERLYWKASLFDRLVKFDVQVGVTRHSGLTSAAISFVPCPPSPDLN
jgi:hypothetical protein